jgi:phage tail sheath protein FI
VTCPKVEIADTNGNVTLDWLSSRLAGLIAQVDKNQTDYSGQTGYWCSPSNYVLAGVIGVETIFPYNPKDTDSALNYMNSQGLVSVLNVNGSGYRSWGNHSTGFPASADPLTFITWRRTMDIIEESIQFFTLQFLDQPMFTRPGELATTLIGQVELSVNDFIRSKIGTALVAGRCYLSLDDNPVSALANGHITYRIEATPPAPMERVTHQFVVDVNGLKTVFAQLVGA